MSGVNRIGIPSCAIRLLCHVPVGMVSVVGTRLYHAADELDQSIFNTIPHGTIFFHGIEILARAATATFVWNTIQWLFSGIWHNYILAAVGVVDLGLAGTLLTGIVFQSRFLPHSYSECRNAASWKTGSDSRNFFVVSAGGTEDPDAACRRFVRIWVLSIVLVTLYIICGIVNILFGLWEKHILPPEPPKPQWNVYSTYSSPPDPNQQRKESPYPKIYAYLLIIGAVLDFLQYSTNALRFGFRCTGKFLASLRQKPSSPPATEEAATPHGCLSTSAECTMSECFICAARICTKCQCTIQMPDKTDTLNHLYKCHQWCSRCMFFKSMSFLGHGTYPYTSIYYPSVPQGNKAVCGTCNKKTAQERTDLLEARQKVEIQRLAKLPLLCRACNEPLRPTGPRWWVTPESRRECKHASHPGWVNR